MIRERFSIWWHDTVCGGPTVHETANGIWRARCLSCGKATTGIVLGPHQEPAQAKPVITSTLGKFLKRA